MAEGRSRALWAHTSHVLWMLASVHRDPKKTRPYRPAQFNPHAPKRRRRKPSVEGLTRALLAVAANKKKGR